MSNPTSTLLLFTDTYPYGKDEQFLETELKYLALYFKAIKIFPRRYGRSKTARPVPDSVQVMKPFIENESHGALLRRGLFSCAPLAPMFRDFFDQKVYGSATRIRKWTEATLLARHLYAHPSIRMIRDQFKDHALLYFYWACGNAWVLPLLDLPLKSVSRFHGYDIYEERPENSGYIAFRKPFLKKLDQACMVSEHGRDYLVRKYPDMAERTRVFRLGVEDAGLAQSSSDDVLRIVTCSQMIPLKRLDLLIAALAEVNSQVEWTHLGDGPLRESIIAQSKTLPGHITCGFPGLISNQELRRLYRESRIDLFLNLSTTEGAPVSIMEALSAGVPVFATSVGGVPELVDQEVGCLFDVSVTPSELALAIDTFAGDAEGRKRFAEKARSRWAQIADAERNYKTFGEFLSKLITE